MQKAESSRSNKKSGTDFENDFRKILHENGFWSHKLVENENGAPFDIIALKDGQSYAFDCKECGARRFPLRRIEDNQVTGMISIAAAQAETYFVFRFEKRIRIAPADYLFGMLAMDQKSADIMTFADFEGWLLCH